MLKQKIYLSTAGVDANLNIAFKTNYNLAGFSEDIDRLVSGQTASSINIPNDGESVKFAPATSYLLKVYFYSTGSTSFVGKIAPNEFTISSITTSSFNNSFYIYKIFDSPFENNQNLIYTGYLNGYNFNGLSSTGYTWTTFYEYSDIHISNTYLASLSADTFSLYMKLNFYSAMSGNVYSFTGTTFTNTENDLYNVFTFTKSTQQYSVTAPLTFYELHNPDYSAIINDSVSSLEFKQQIYPTGTTFTNQGIYS